MKLVLADVEGDALDGGRGRPAASSAEVVTRRGRRLEGRAGRGAPPLGPRGLRRRPRGVQQRRRGLRREPVESVSLDDWEWVLGVNLWGVIHGVRTFLPLLQAQGEGHIVNTASVAGLFAAPFMGPYNVSKYGVVALSETLFNELRHRPVGRGRVGAVPVVGEDPHRRVRPQPARRRRRPRRGRRDHRGHQRLHLHRHRARPRWPRPSPRP